MKLSDLKKLVDAAAEDAAKHRIDPQVLFFDSNKEFLNAVERAEIESGSNMDFNCGELEWDQANIELKANLEYFVLSDWAEAFE